MSSPNHTSAAESNEEEKNDLSPDFDPLIGPRVIAWGTGILIAWCLLLVLLWITK